MTDDAASANARAVIGGNDPPAEIDFVETSLKPLTELRADGKLAERVAQLVRNANRWKAEIPTIGDQEVANACHDFIDQLRLEYKTINEERAGVLKPIDAQRDSVHGAYMAALDLLKASGDALTVLQKDWLRREEKRIADEKAIALKAAAEAQRKAQEAEEAARAKDAPVEAVVAARAAVARAEDATEVAHVAQTQKAGVVGTYSRRATGLRSNWTCEITDWAEAAKALSTYAAVREAIQKAANKLAVEQKQAMEVGWGKSKEERI